jgi:tRNA1(Val) A37 N6-methylase TrmN6
VDKDLTQDDFIGGKLRVFQPRKGYRAGVDPVLLAASIAAKPGQSILELGCGVGVASLCICARVPGVAVTGVELQEDYATLARKNAVENAADFTVINADLRKLPADVRQKRFHHVIMNPPYFDRASSVAAQDAGRDVALAGDTPLADWLDIGARRVGPRGYLTIIQRMERLPEVIAALNGRLGAINVRPIAGRDDRAPELFLLQARQEGRGAFHMAPALIMHEGQAHTGDHETYTPKVRAILRDGAALNIRS